MSCVSSFGPASFSACVVLDEFEVVSVVEDSVSGEDEP
jgi:hypothetical protein